MDSLPTIVPLIEVLAKLRPASARTRLRQLLEHERVRVNGEVVKIGRMPIAPDDVVEIMPAQRAREATAPFEVVYEDADLLVIDKPAGMLTSTVPTEKRPTALALARAYMASKRPRARVGLVHRLDRDASGLLVFSLNEPALKSFKAQFFDHSAARIYAAIVRGAPRPVKGTIRSRLVEYADGTVHRTTHTNKGDDAVTHYQTISSQSDRSLLRVTLETGRKHQIRAHLSERGHPILGDTLYAGPPAPRLMLAAIELHLTHPRSQERLRLTIDLPKPLTALLRDKPADKSGD